MAAAEEMSRMLNGKGEECRDAGGRFPSGKQKREGKK